MYFMRAINYFLSKPDTFKQSTAITYYKTTRTYVPAGDWLKPENKWPNY